MTPEEFMRFYEVAGREHGADGMLELIDDKAVFWFSTGDAHVGKPAIGKAIRHNLETIKDETYTIKDLTWLAQDETIAVCCYRYEWSGNINGQPASGQGRGTSVLKRHKHQDGEGAWRIVHEHLSKGDTGRKEPTPG